MNQLIIPIPEADPHDVEDVVTALETAGIFGLKGESKEAIRWLRRAAQSASESGQDARSAMLARAAADLSDRFGSRPAPPPLPGPPPLPRTGAVDTAEALPLVTKAPEPPAKRDDVGAKTLESAGVSSNGSKNGSGYPHASGSNGVGRVTTAPPAPSSRLARGASETPKPAQAAPKPSDAPRAGLTPTPHPSSLSLGLNGKRPSAAPQSSVAPQVTRPSTVNGSLSARPATMNGSLSARPPAANGSLRPSAVNGSLSARPSTNSGGLSARPSTSTSLGSVTRPSSLPPTSIGNRAAGSALSALKSGAPAPRLEPPPKHEQPASETLTPPPVAVARVMRLEAPQPNYDDPTPLKTSSVTAPHHHAVRVAVTPTSQPGVYEMRVLRLGELVVSGAQEALVVLLAPGSELGGK